MTIVSLIYLFYSSCLSIRHILLLQKFGKKVVEFCDHLINRNDFVTLILFETATEDLERYYWLSIFDFVYTAAALLSIKDILINFYENKTLTFTKLGVILAQSYIPILLSIASYWAIKTNSEDYERKVLLHGKNAWIHFFDALSMSLLVFIKYIGG